MATEKLSDGIRLFAADSLKLEKFLAKFGTLYDQANSTSSGATPASLLLSNDNSVQGFSESMLASLQGLRLGRV